MSFGDAPTSAIVTVPPFTFVPVGAEPPEPIFAPLPAAHAAIEVARASAAAAARIGESCARPTTPSAGDYPERENISTSYYLSRHYTDIQADF